MDEIVCYAYNNMPDANNSMEAILYDQGYGVQIDTFIYYQVLECDQIVP
jgi:hypothetical protein